MATSESAYLRVANGFGHTLSTVQEGQWENRTPCDEWNASELVAHVVATHQRVYSIVVPNGILELDGDATLLEQWEVVTATMRQSLNDPGLANASVQTRAGEQPFSALVEGLVMIDTLCHTWDLARTINADESLDEAAVAIAYDKLTEMGNAIRVPGGFKDPIVPLPNADAQTRFLNFTGRAV
jgi:uncharacterized protein (TIGR03086 family)